MKKWELVNQTNKYIGKNKNFYVSRRYSTEETYAMHRHEYFEVEIVLTGSGMQNLNGELYPLRRGIVYFLTNTDFHELKIKEPLLNYNISMNLLSVSPEFMKKSLTTTQRVFTPGSSEFNRLCLLAELLENASAELSTAAQYSSMLLYCFLDRLGTLVDTSEKINTPTVSSAIQDVILYIHANFRNDPSLDELADFAHLSRNYMSNLFKKETGITLIKYISALKIEYAKKLLTITDMAITDICFDCGFRSIPNFIRSFKLQTGCSPQEFRKAVRSDNEINARPINNVTIPLPP